jgi:hypothetical protein
MSYDKPPVHDDVETALIVFLLAFLLIYIPLGTSLHLRGGPSLSRFFPPFRILLSLGVFACILLFVIASNWVYPSKHHFEG